MQSMDPYSLEFDSNKLPQSTKLIAVTTFYNKNQRPIFEENSRKPYQALHVFLFIPPLPLGMINFQQK